MSDQGSEEPPKFTVLRGEGKEPEKFLRDELLERGRELRDHAHSLLASRPSYQKFYGIREEITETPEEFRTPRSGNFNGVRGELRTELTPVVTTYEATFFHQPGSDKIGAETITLRIPVPGMKSGLPVIEYKLLSKDGIPVEFEDGPDAYREIWKAFNERFSPPEVTLRSV